MAGTTPRGIQATLFDYFQDTEYFTVKEAEELVLDHQQRDVNAESIRARIYEGIDKGLFERVGKGLYMVTRQDEQGRENTCLLINGDGRDLSMFPDNSVDALITDHPYSLKTSLKGGNRNFADYELFQYNEEDFRSKHRVLKSGSFCVEFLPEENGDNYQYLFNVKEMARKSGLEYFAKVPWKKQGFVANTGRKSKDTEDICFFTKGRARELRPDAKKDKQYENSRTVLEFRKSIPGSVLVHYSQGSGLGSSSESKTEVIDVNIRISIAKEDAEKAKQLLEKAWDDVSLMEYDKSPLDRDYGGQYSLDELFDMPAQKYIWEYLTASKLAFVDLSPGVEDIFKAGTEVIVNPTNLMGPMGAGLAKEFKERFPLLEETYKESCRQRKYSSAADGFKSIYGPGDEILISETRPLFEGNLFLMGGNPGMNKPAVLCFPTKRDWKDPSDLALIEAGLKTFVQNYKHCNIKSITFPKLGCGLGGLNWEKEVKPLMQKYLENLPDLDVQICGDTLREDKKHHFMSGAHGMLPVEFSISPPSKKDKIHQAEKPVALIEEILNYVTLPGETVLDQFAGSGVLGEAAMNTGRNSILIEKDVETFQKLTQRLQMLGSIEALTPAAKSLASIGADAMVAQDAFNRTGDRNIIYNFVKTHNMPEPSVLYEGEKDLRKVATPEQAEAVTKAFDAIEDIDLRSSDLDLSKDSHRLHAGEQSPSEKEPKVLECSSRGDRRFSALFAKVTIKGKKRSIEEFYQDAKRTADGKKAGKGKPFDHIVDPFTGDKLPSSEASNLYKGLWITYFTKNPDLVEYAKGFDEFNDMFRGPNTINCQADVIAAYMKAPDTFVTEIKRSPWYQNMASKVKPSLSKQIQSAQSKGAEQMSFINEKAKPRSHWQTSR